MKWNPGKVLAEIAYGVARKAAAQVRASAPRVAHRAGKNPAGEIGGSIARYILRKDFVRWDRTKAVLQFHALGPEALWFRNGTSRQKARPFDLLPDPGQVRQKLEADARKHFAKRVQRMSA